MASAPADPCATADGDAARFEAVRALFHAALDHPAAERRAWLAGACTDGALRAEVESLLRRADEAGNFLEPPSSGPAETLDASQVSGLIGRRIGPYRLVGLLGRGAMGLVFDAEQEHPRRRVALKVMRSLPWLDDLAPRLFEREVQALARMEHHGIAAIHAAGRTDDGWCWFAMERVEGVPLTRYAAERGLGPHERLALLARLCEAVHYAHQRGVIHRDLKPSNVLVNAAGQPKVLDFGVARITEADADATRVTQPGSFHGTLAYASPEQVRCRPDEIDARTDVYSLGVMGFELLTGALPYDVAGRSLSQAMSTICEQAPRPASALDRRLCGEPETILGKALAKEPAERYSSAGALGEDIGRYLAGLPILAHPPTAAYQLRKLVARHRGVTALGATLVLVLVASAVVTGRLAFRFATQRNLARGAQAEATRERDAAEEFAGLLENLLEGANAAADLDEEPSLRGILDSGRARLPEIEDERVRARLMTVMGSTYGAMGEFLTSRELLESALETRRRVLGPRHPDTLDTLGVLAGLHIRASFEGAETLTTELIELRRQELGEEHELVAFAWNQRGEQRYYAGDLAGALEDLERAVAIRRRIHAGPSEATAVSLANLGRTLTALGRTEDAERTLRESLEMRRALGDPEGIEWTLEGLAILVASRDARAGEELALEELAVARTAYHAHHPRLVWILTNCGTIVTANRGAAAAEPFFLEALEICHAVDIPRDHLGRSLKMYGECLLAQSRLDEAAEVLIECVDVFEASYGPEDTRTAGVRTLLERALGSE